MNNKVPIKEYSFQDSTTSILDDKIWADVPGFEESFKVSNLARVKSLDREVSHSRCGTQFVKGRLLKQNIKKHYIQFTNDYVYILQVRPEKTLRVLQLVRDRTLHLFHLVLSGHYNYT